MADEQGSTLAFLQNFYTDITLYMPFEAHERPPVPAQAAVPAVALAPAPVAAAPAAPSPPAAQLPPAQRPPAAPPAIVPPTPAAAPTAGKLPSLAGAGLTAPPKVAPGPAPVSVAAEVPPYLLTTFSTLGHNAQGVVLLVRLPAERFAKLPRNVFLNNLLKAIGLVMADVVLVNVEGPYPVALSTLRKELAAARILAFGRNLLDVAVRTTQIYEPVQFPNVGLAYLAGAEIEMIEYDVSLKKRLWGGLQRMFLA